MPKKSKVCSKCRGRKPLSEFNRQSCKPDGLQTVCRACNKAYGKRYYRANKAKFQERNERRRAEHLAWVSTLRAKPCMDCGGSFPPCCMDFDHREGEEKTAAVADLVRRSYSKEAILAEIAKCDLVCANCHRVRTHTAGVPRYFGASSNGKTPDFEPVNGGSTPSAPADGV